MHSMLPISTPYKLSISLDRSSVAMVKKQMPIMQPVSKSPNRPRHDTTPQEARYPNPTKSTRRRVNSTQQNHYKHRRHKDQKQTIEKANKNTPEEKSFSGRRFLAHPFASSSFSPYAMPLPALPKYRFFGNVLIILELLCSLFLLVFGVGWFGLLPPQGGSLRCVLCCLIMGRGIGNKIPIL